MRKFTWKPPVAKPKDRVRFIDHRGNLLEGVVHNIETRYDDSLKARHVYQISVPWRSRCEWHGDKSISAVLPHSPPIGE